MALANVPIVPQWNLINGCCCTPDGGFLYVGSKSINYIGPIENGETAPEMRIFHTRQTILSVDVDPGWQQSISEKSVDVGVVADEKKEGIKEQKYFAVLAQDNSVQIWDFVKGCAISGHKAHFNLERCCREGSGPPQPGEHHVLFSYMKNRNVLSVDPQDLVVYCVASNTYCRRPMFVSSRNQQLTALRCSPYNEHLFALGTSRGLVVIGDLHRMCVVYTLRGHDNVITSLSWRVCEKRSTEMQKETKVDELKRDNKREKSSPPTAIGEGNDEIFDIYDYDYLENEFGVSCAATTTTTNAAVIKNSEPSNDFVGIEKSQDGITTTMTAKFDFAEACQSLKEEIEALKSEPPPPESMEDIVTLEDCKKAALSLEQTSSDDESNESVEGSLELIDQGCSVSSSSDDAVDVDGCDRKPKQQILHQAEVHNAQAVETVDGKNNSLEDVKKTKDLADDDCCKGTPVPVLPNIKGEKIKLKDSSAVAILLVSSCNNGSIWVWNTETGAACDNMKSHGNPKLGKNVSIEAAWLNENQIIATNKTGELIYWNMLGNKEANPSNQQQRFKFKEDKRHGIQRGIVSFSIAKGHSRLWGISYHREIVCVQLPTDEIVAKYSCASTNIAAIRECPDDMNKIALGFCDRRIGILDISKISPTNIHIENFTTRIESPVLALAWSPDSKKIAYGTIEGRVGVLHVENGNKQTFVFNTLCGKPIYSIDWQESYIYVVWNDILGVYDDNMENRDAHIIEDIKDVSCVSVRGDFIFAGTRRGHLQVFRRKAASEGHFVYSLQQNLPLAPRYITEIAWSPIKSEQMAIVANSNVIHILNFNGENGVVTPMRKIDIKNAKAANACVKWSNRNANEFLTCGFDGAIRVWDLTQNSNDEKFLKQFHCPMICGLFLPTDENVVVCAGKSTSMEWFDMRIEKSTDYSPSKWKRSNAPHTLDNVQWALKVTTRSDAKNVTNATQKRRKKRGSGDVNRNGEEDNSNDIEHTQVVDMINTLNIGSEEKHQELAEKIEDEGKSSIQKLLKVEKSNSYFMKNPTTLLYLTTKELNKDVLEKLRCTLNALIDKKAPKSNLLCSKLFGTKAEAKQVLAEELKNYKDSESKGISSIFMPQLNASIKDEILLCIQKKTLSEWHVSLAPTISYNFWQKCCQAFAEQLLEEGFALQAATYMIALHQQTEAIEMLMMRNYFKEALLIARIYLQGDDPLVNTITDKWISYLDFTGNLLGAALLCVLSGQMNRAFETLIKIRNMQPEVENLLRLIKAKESAF